jgi:hypothetical protein
LRYRLIVLAILASSFQSLAHAADPVKITLYRNPNCGCCNLWADYMKGQGFEVVRVDTYDMASIKKKYGVPARLEGCHTAVAGPYVFEGLLPAEHIRRVLKETRPIKGIALPGMPTGVPGMPGRKAGPLDVYYISDSPTPGKFASF